ncbi:MAG: phosphonate C-P lyase system protein PhnG [Acetobacteraceae bacterium]|nr:phosphonate C-P lyase system protein PhnG [Acetobacteraceae bacterium]
MQTGPDTAQRRGWMAVLARAEAEAIAAGLGQIADLPRWSVLRGPESGLVMVRGRAGGGGAAFNLGEMTVTRCTVRIASGEVGHAYVAGRDPRRAELAAAGDALMQRSDLRDAVERSVIAPLARAQDARRQAVAAKAAATRVQFFTMRTMR